MPWFLQKRGDEWCVRKGTKEDPEKIVKCHSTRPKALAHLRAIYVNYQEKGLGEGQGVGGDPQGVGGVSQCICPECGTVIDHDRGTPCAEQKCPECKASMLPNTKTSKDATPVSVGALLESRIHSTFTVAADILYGLGYLDKEERLRLSGAIGDSLDELAKVTDELKLRDRSVDTWAAKTLLGLAHGDDPAAQQQSTSLFVPYKDATTSEDRWVCVSTIAMKDLENETFTEEAMDYDIKRAHSSGDFPELRLYHIRGFRLGKCDHMSRIGKWAVDKGMWNRTRFAQAMKDVVRSNPGRWGVSRGFHVVKATGLCSKCGADLMVSPWNFLFGVQCKSCGTAHPDISKVRKMRYLQAITYDLSVTDVPIVPDTAIAAYDVV